MMTKRDRIRRLAARGYTRLEIARRTGYKLNYIDVSLWLVKHPTYHAKWMAEKRRGDRNYYLTEMERQRMRNWKT